MPLPLLWLAAGIFGAGKLAGAYVDNDDARKINLEAHELADFGEELMEDAQKHTRRALESLGKKKANVLTTSVKNFVDLFSKIHNIDFNATPNTSELDSFRMDQSSFDGLKHLSSVSLAITDASAAALTAFAAYGTASLLGLPSAGAAITALTGLASNSTLAFLSGSSLAAGATSVLGGVIGAPVLAVLGIFVESSAARNLEDARSNKAQALKFAKQVDAGAAVCNGIRKMAYLYDRLLMRLDPRMRAANEKLSQVIAANGTDWQAYSPEAKAITAYAASTAKLVKTAIDANILTQDGSPDQKALDTANEIRKVL